MTYRLAAQVGATSSFLTRAKAVPITAVARIAALTSPLRIKTFVESIQGKFPQAGYDQALQWRNAVNSVSPRCAGNGCLQRSIAVVLMAATAGRSVQWKAGFRTEPFLAHAWVEVNGEPVGEPEEVKNYRTTIASRPITG